MHLTIQAKFKSGFAKKKVEAFVQRLDAAILMQLQYIGEQFLIDARNGGGHKDQTGSLRSSISYVILKDGQVHTNGGFVLVKQGAKGVTKGQKFIQQIVKQYPKGWVLVGFAGESYAAAVESRGFDVITGAALQAKDAMRTAIQKLKGKVK